MGEQTVEEVDKLALTNNQTPAVVKRPNDSTMPRTERKYHNLAQRIQSEGKPSSKQFMQLGSYRDHHLHVSTFRRHTASDTAGDQVQLRAEEVLIPVEFVFHGEHHMRHLPLFVFIPHAHGSESNSFPGKHGVIKVSPDDRRRELSGRRG